MAGQFTLCIENLPELLVKVRVANAVPDEEERMFRG